MEPKKDETMSDDRQLLLPASSNASTLPPPYEALGQAPSTATANMPYPHFHSPYPYPTTGYAGQPPVTNYQTFPPQFQQRQQQQVVYVGNPPIPVPVVIHGTPQLSFTPAIALSCIVFWLCGMLFGGIAFILAMIGQSTASEGDVIGAIRLRSASYGLSIFGICFGIILIITMFSLTSQAGHYPN